MLAGDFAFPVHDAICSDRGFRGISPIDSGMVFINHATWTAPDLPFGGVKNGFGGGLSAPGIEEFK
jgi:succinate-semialdehyde dehydrogenase / glutarate-semialdehyde dehydrogenase